MDKLKLRIIRRLEVYLELDIDGLRKFIIDTIRNSRFPIEQFLQFWVIFIQSSDIINSVLHKNTQIYF